MIAFNDNFNDDALPEKKYGIPNGYRIIADTDNLLLVESESNHKPPRYIICTRESSAKIICLFDSLSLGLWILTKLQQNWATVNSADIPMVGDVEPATPLPDGWRMIHATQHLMVTKYVQAKSRPQYMLSTHEQNSEPICMFDSLQFGLWLMEQLQTTFDKM